MKEEQRLQRCQAALLISLHEARRMKRAAGRYREHGRLWLIWISWRFRQQSQKDHLLPGTLGRWSIEVIMLKLSFIQFLLGQPRN